MVVAAVMAAGCGGGSGSYDNNSPTAELGSDIHGVVHEDKSADRIARAQKIEPLLEKAGFKSMPVDTPAKHKVIEGLTPLAFNRLAHKDKIRYWFSDPYYCNCVFEGDDLAYQRYKQEKHERKKEHVEEADIANQDMEIDMPMDTEWDPVGAFGMP
jgi:hypothetical protein